MLQSWGSQGAPTSSRGMCTAWTRWELELKRVREGSECRGVDAKGWPHPHGCGLDVDIPGAVFHLAFKRPLNIRDQEVLSDANA